MGFSFSDSYQLFISVFQAVALDCCAAPFDVVEVPCLAYAVHAAAEVVYAVEPAAVHAAEPAAVRVAEPAVAHEVDLGYQLACLPVGCLRGQVLMLRPHALAR